MWLIFAIIAAILWGLNYSLAERILLRITPLTLVTVELWIGTLMFTLISYFTSLKKDLLILATEPSTRWLTLAEAIVVVVASFFIVSSIHLKNATVAGIIELTYPLFTILFTWFFFHQIHVNTSVIIGGVLIFVGVVIISLA